MSVDENFGYGTVENPVVGDFGSSGTGSDRKYYMYGGGGWIAIAPAPTLGEAKQVIERLSELLDRIASDHAETEYNDEILEALSESTVMTQKIHFATGGE